MANEIVMTKEGYDDLVKELNELKTTRRAEISEKIRVARGFGDLSENSEYDEAKNPTPSRAPFPWAALSPSVTWSSAMR